MSDMKTFTVRQLDRETAMVLKAVNKEGVVRIKSRDGRTYRLQPEARLSRITALPDFHARIKRIFPQPIPRTQAKLFDKLLAGE
jgi:hypothetical protein